MLAIDTMVRRIPQRVKTSTLITFCLMLLATVSVAQSSSQCPNSTVEDAWGTKVASQAQSFLKKLQQTVRAGNKREFALLVQYPVRVLNGSHAVEVSSASRLVERYSSIVTPAVKQAILKQSGPCLFANSQGIMVGSGQIWFQKQPGGEMKIITINSSVPSRK